MYSGVAPILLSQLASSNDKVYIPMIIGCLGNLCDEEKCRNILLSNRIIEVTLTILNKVSHLMSNEEQYYLNQDIMENCVFLLKNAFTSLSCSSQSRLRELKTILTTYIRIVDASPKQIEFHTGIISDMMQFCLSVMENNDATISILVVDLVIRLLTIMSNAVDASRAGLFDAASNYPTKSILECLGNMFAENDLYTTKLIPLGLFTFLMNIYTDPNSDDLLIKLEVLFCWMNIAGGTYSQQLFDSGILQILVDNITALNDQSSDISFEASRRSMVVLCNFICECNDDVRDCWVD